MFYFGVPFCSVIVLSFWGFNPFGLRDRAPLWVKAVRH